jgi:hypothetical protein
VGDVPVAASARRSFFARVALVFRPKVPSTNRSPHATQALDRRHLITLYRKLEDVYEEERQDASGDNEKE